MLLMFIQMKTKAEKNYINLGVYLCMFPQLIAGPIVVYKDIAKQIRKRKVSLLLLQDGIRNFYYGSCIKNAFGKYNGNVLGVNQDLRNCKHINSNGMDCDVCIYIPDLL